MEIGKHSCSDWLVQESAFCCEYELFVKILHTILVAY